MNWFMIFWMIAGFWIGFFACQLMFGLIKRSSTRLMDTIWGMIGVLIVYTIFNS